MHSRVLPVVSALIALIAACVDDGALVSTPDPRLTQRGLFVVDYVYRQPHATDDGWPTAHAAAAGLDVALLSELLQKTLDGEYNREHSILIAKSGQLVFEEYFDGRSIEGRRVQFNADTLHTMQSVSKSVTSALIGIAIDQGLITGTDATALALLPNFSGQLGEPIKQTITLKHMLTMSAGLEWDENSFPYSDPRNDRFQQLRTTDAIAYVLEKPVTSKPGTVFAYNSGLTTVIGAALRSTSGMEVEAYARTFLFEPLGITHIRWRKEFDGNTDTSAGLYLRPRDMLKIGQLFLDGGVSQQQQLIPSHWVTISTATKVSVHNNYYDYGYQWWTARHFVKEKDYRSFSARGYGDQYIFVVPDLELVVVFTAGNYNSPGIRPEEQLERYILPAAM